MDYCAMERIYVIANIRMYTNIDFLLRSVHRLLVLSIWGYTKNRKNSFGKTCDTYTFHAGHFELHICIFN